MPAPSAKAIYEAAERAIFELLVDGKQEASFMGKSYKALDISQLEKVRDYYKAQAVANGEIDPNENTTRVVVSYADCQES